MINYTEKGIGMHYAMRAVGLRMHQENGEWVLEHQEEDFWVKSIDEHLFQDFIDNYTLLDAATTICNQIDEYAGQLRIKVTKGISPAEMSSWPLKISEAQAVKAGGDPNDARLLKTEATMRGVTVDSIADRVLGNFDRLGSIEATIAGVAGKHKDGVRSQLSYEAIASYNWKTDWPVI